MAIKAGKVVQRTAPPKKEYVVLTPAVAANKVEQVRKKDKKIRAEDKPKVKIRSDNKRVDKKIRAEDKGRKIVQINRPVQQYQTSSREILKPSRYVDDLIS
jgi:hypothetical protein